MVLARWRSLSQHSSRRKCKGSKPRPSLELLESRTVLSFTAPLNFPIGGGPESVAVGDLNNDGKVDLVAPAGASGVSALLGNGDGTFGSRIDSSNNPQQAAVAWSIALGDFNADGKLDAAVSNLNGNVSVLMGNGDGSFRPPTSTFIGPDARSVTVGDFNGDGKLDIASVSVGTDQRNPGTTVALMFGRGDGSFSAPARWSVGNEPIFVASGDFNGDGKTDLVTANYKDGTISELLSNGNGSFQGLRNFGIGTHPVSISVRDLNGDGKLDMAVGLAGGSVNFLFGKGDGSFSTGKKIDTSTAVNSVATADFNGDGKMDVVVANNQANTVSVLMGNGNGTFQAPVNYTTGTQPWNVVASDLNGDGRPDLVTANISSSDVTVFLNQGTGAFPTIPSTPVGATPLAMARADLNGDGKLDLITANAYSNTVSVLLGLGNGSFQPAVDFAVGERPAAVTVGDFNGDCKLDLAVANSNMTSISSLDNVSILLGNGDGTFQAAVNYATGINPNAIVAADFNGDGKLDLATANTDFNNANAPTPGGNTVSILLGNGDGTFQPAQNFDAGGAHPLSLATADFNGDGKADLVVANTSYLGTTSALTLLLGNGDGTFQAPSAVLSGAMAGSVSVADLNGDGRLDLVVTNGPTVGLILSTSTGSFAKPKYYLVGASAWATVVGDFNGDGIPDLAVADSIFGGSGGVFMLINDGKPF